MTQKVFGRQCQYSKSTGLGVGRPDLQSWIPILSWRLSISFSAPGFPHLEHQIPVRCSPEVLYFPCACVCASCFSHVWLFATLRTVVHQAPLSTGFSRQEYWSGVLCPPPGDLPHPGIKTYLLNLLHWQVGSLPANGRLKKWIFNFTLTNRASG